jgi:hypothetical protein
LEHEGCLDEVLLPEHRREPNLVMADPPPARRERVLGEHDGVAGAELAYRRQVELPEVDGADDEDQPRGALGGGLGAAVAAAALLADGLAQPRSREGFGAAVEVTDMAATPTARRSTTAMASRDFLRMRYHLLWVRWLADERMPVAPPPFVLQACRDRTDRDTSAAPRKFCGHARDAGRLALRSWSGPAGRMLEATSSPVEPDTLC